MDVDGHPQRFAGRIDGPDGERQSAWLTALKPRTDAPQSAARQAIDDGDLHVVELTREHIARITSSDEDAEQMAATGIHWWVVIPLAADGRRLGLLHFGLRPGARRADREAARPPARGRRPRRAARWSPRS